MFKLNICKIPSVEKNKEKTKQTSIPVNWKTIPGQDLSLFIFQGVGKIEARLSNRTFNPKLLKMSREAHGSVCSEHFVNKQK